jgi:hypothetical protein
MRRAHFAGGGRRGEPEFSQRVIAAVKLVQPDNERRIAFDRLAQPHHERMLLPGAAADTPAVFLAVAISVDGLSGGKLFLLVGRRCLRSRQLLLVALDVKLREHEVAALGTSGALFRQRRARQGVEPQRRGAGGDIYRDHVGVVRGTAIHLDLDRAVLTHGEPGKFFRRRTDRAKRRPRHILRLNQRLLPCRLRRIQRRRRGIQLTAQLGDLFLQPREALALLGRRHEHPIFALADDRLLDVREERAHRVEVAHRDRVELVVMALRAADRRAEPGRADGAHPVGEHPRFVILRLCAAFLR